MWCIQVHLDFHIYISDFHIRKDNLVDRECVFLLYAIYLGAVN